MKQKIADLEREKEQTYEILSRSDARIDGLTQEDTLKYADYLKLQITQMKKNELNIDFKAPEFLTAENLESDLVKQLRSHIEYLELNFKTEVQRMFGQPAHHRPTDDSEALNQHYQELKIAMTKLWAKYEDMKEDESID